MISAVLDHPAAAQKVKDDAQRLLLELETSLGPERFKTAQVEAQTLSLETVVAMVLSTFSLAVPPPGDGAAES